MNDSDKAGADDRRYAPRWMWITLVASLAVNLLIVGAIGGSLWVMRDRDHAFRGPAMSGHHMRRFIRSLPGDRQAEVRRVLAEARRGARERWQAVRQARSAALKELEREPFDRNAYAGALGKVHAAERRARDKTNELFVNLAATLTAQERRAFVKWVHERGERRRHWRRGLHERRWREQRDGAGAAPSRPPR